MTTRRNPFSGYTVGGTFEVIARRGGRQNLISWRVLCGAKLVGIASGAGICTSKDEAVKLAQRCDRLVARWRSM